MTASITFSAVLPNYNSSAFLHRSIESLLNQSEPLHELIIVDDGSTDHSFDIIQTYLEKYDFIRLLKHESNLGVSAALNTGIKMATGDYILLCAADDIYDKNMMASAKSLIERFPQVGLVCGDAMVKR